MCKTFYKNRVCMQQAENFHLMTSVLGSGVCRAQTNLLYPLNSSVNEHKVCKDFTLFINVTNFVYIHRTNNSYSTKGAMCVDTKKIFCLVY